MAEFVDVEDLPVALATALRAAGLRWRPAPGDRFVVTTDTLEGDVFTVSDMVVEVIGHGSGEPVLGFNGTTEWALDSIAMDSAVWLPREGQLRRLLGRAFRRLEVADEGFRVTIARFAAPLPPESPGVQAAAPDGAEAGEETFDGASGAEAYGRALLAVISRALA